MQQLILQEHPRILVNPYGLKLDHISLKKGRYHSSTSTAFVRNDWIPIRRQNIFDGKYNIRKKSCQVRAPRFFSRSNFDCTDLETSLGQSWNREEITRNMKVQSRKALSSKKSETRVLEISQEKRFCKTWRTLKST